MSKHMKIFLIVLFSLGMALFVFVKIIYLYEDYRIQKKFGALNDVKIEEVETLPIDQVMTQFSLYADLNEYLKEDRHKNVEEINEKIKDLFPKFYKIKDKWSMLAHKRISKIFENRMKNKY